MAQEFEAGRFRQYNVNGGGFVKSPYAALPKALFIKPFVF